MATVGITDVVIGQGSSEITVTLVSWRWLWKQKRVVTFTGKNLIWRDTTTGKRPSLEIERLLADREREAMRQLRW